MSPERSVTYVSVRSAIGLSSHSLTAKDLALWRQRQLSNGT